MQLGKRMFPHPVLKVNPNGDYNHSFFKLEYLYHELTNELQFNELQFTTNNSFFRQLVDTNQVKVFVRFECSNTLYQEKIDISKHPVSFSINKADINGKLVFNAFAFASEEILDFTNEDFSPLYGDTLFDIDKYDIIAFDDGASININHDIDANTKTSSIFAVVPDEDENGSVTFNHTRDKIVIKLPKMTFNQYDRISKSPRYKNIFFSMLAIPILSSVLNELKGENFDELFINYKWFVSVSRRYKELKRVELNEETFKTLNPYEFAQEIFDNAIVQSIDEMFNEGNREDDLDDSDLY